MLTPCFLPTLISPLSAKLKYLLSPIQEATEISVHTSGAFQYPLSLKIAD